jgi:predicted nucleotidyltransferase
LRSVEESYRGRKVRVFRLHRERVLAALRDRAVRLVDAHPEVLEIRLFGSLARAAAKPGSDADLLVVLKDGAGPVVERVARIAPHFEGVGVGCDVFVYTESEWSALAREGRKIVTTVLNEGILLTP